jgi:hypothetical protein
VCPQIPQIRSYRKTENREFNLPTRQLESTEMNFILRDLALAVLWALLIYCAALMAAEPIKNFIEPEPNRLIFLTTVSIVLITLFSSGFSSFFRRAIKTYLAVGYQSLTAMNLLVGTLGACVAIQTVLWENKFDYLMAITWIFIAFALAGMLLASLTQRREERKTSESHEDTDLLNRKIFIKKVISLLEDDGKLISKSDDEALVIWIASRWGTGKTWILKKIQKQFQKKNKSEKVIWFSFNPWLHSAANPELALVEAFFSQLRDEVSKQFFLEGLNKNISNYTKSILSQGTQKLFDLDISNVFSTSETTEDLKAHISDFLVRGKLKLVITFDEVDRLTPVEMVTCLRLVRSLANFSNTVILVCGAPDKIELLLKEAGLPHDYLEKISHVPLSLPLVGVNDLLDVLWAHIDGENLNSEEKKALEKVFSNLRSNIFHNNDQASLFNNLRVVERLADVIKLDLLAQDKLDELDCFDFVNLQLIRLNCFPLYEAIKNNKTLWIGDIQGEKAEAVAARKTKIDKIVSAALEGEDDKKDALQRVLQQMFPVCKEGIHAFHYISSKNRTSINVEDSFDRYFVEGLPEGQVSNKAIKNLAKDWESGVNIKDSLSSFSAVDIAWVYRELVTTKPVELSDQIKIKLAKFLVDEKLDRGVEYKNNSYRADPEDFRFSAVDHYLAVTKYYFSKSENVDTRFFNACDYINGLYWTEKRQGIEGIKAEDIEKLMDIAREEFGSRTIDKGVDVLSLNDKDFHYYWVVLSRDSPAFEMRLRDSVANAIEAEASAFCRYIYVYREFARNSKEGFRNNYERREGFTNENLLLARKHLTSQGLSEGEQRDLESFISIAEKHMPKPVTKE